MPDIIKTFKRFTNLFSGKEDYKVYFSESAPKLRFRRAGTISEKDANKFQKKGDINWQAAQLEEEDWQKVSKTIKDTVLLQKVLNDLNNQYQTNLGRKEVKDTISNLNLQDYWTLITVIACENYSTNLQGMADVAQSIYNRFNIENKSYGQSVSDIILKVDRTKRGLIYQYAPVEKGGLSSWKNIKSKKSAIDVYQKTKRLSLDESTKAIDNAIKAQKDADMIVAAKKHVGARTEFLSNSPSDKKAVGIVERDPSEQNNAFFWNYQGKELYHDRFRRSATAMPDTVDVRKNV